MKESDNALLPQRVRNAEGKKVGFTWPSGAPVKKQPAAPAPQKK